MLTILFLAIMSIVAFTLSQSTFSQMNRMTMAFQVANAPYPPVQKPKPTKGKGGNALHMARVIWSGIGITAGSGKMQGTVLQSNNIVRVKRKPNNVRNAFTQAVRGIFSGESTSWRTLSATQILTWTTAAPLYFSKKVLAVAHALKGNTLFQRVNNILTSLGQANVLTAPGVGIPLFTITAVTPSASAAGATFTADITEFGGLTALPTNSWMKVYATRQVGVGRSSFGKSSYKYIGQFPATTTTNPLDIHADYVARFGAPVVGNRIGLAFEVISFVAAPPTSFAESGKFFAQVVVGA